MSRLRALVVVALLCALAACDDEPTPDLPDPPPSSASPSPTESESSPTTSPTPQALGPEQTVRAWVKARNQALQDGDTSVAEALSAANCETCDNSLGPIRQVYADGGHYETEGWRVPSAKAVDVSSDAARVTAGLVYEPGATVPEAGADPVTYELERHIAEFRLVRVDGQWLISFIGYLS